MDTAFLRAILEHDGAVPEGYSVQGLTPELLELLGSTVMKRPEASLDVLSTWFYRSPDVYYSAVELRTIGRLMAHNLTMGVRQVSTPGAPAWRLPLAAHYLVPYMRGAR